MAERATIYGKTRGTTVASTTDAILKDDYVTNDIRDTVNLSCAFLKRLGKEMMTGGRQFIFPVRFGLGEGQGMRGEMEKLPEAGFGIYAQAKGQVTTQYGRIKISGQALDGTKRAAYTRSLKASYKNCRDAFKLETYRMCWGKKNGVIAQASAAVTPASNAATVNLDNPFGLTYDAAQRVQAPLIRQGMKVVFGTINSTTGAFTGTNSGTVTGITSTGSIKLSQTEDNDAIGNDNYVVQGDSTTANSANKAYRGVMEAMQVTGTYLGISRTDQPGWQCNELDAGGNALSEDLLQEASDMAEIHGDGSARPNLLLSNHKTRRLYQALLHGYKRFMQPLNLRGGQNAISFNGRPWYIDKLCPPEHVMLLHMQDWAWYMQSDVSWVRRGRTGILQQMQDFHAFLGTLYTTRDLVCHKPSNQTMVTGLDT